MVSREGRGADELKLQYKATHIFDDLGNDFFTTEPPAKGEID